MAESLFGSEAPAPKLVKLALGANLGVRDMVAAESAILLLVGPDDSDPAPNLKWYVSEWKDQSGVAVRTLAELDLKRIPFRSCVKEIKPEAITVLNESPTTYKVLVLSDGVCDGGPLVFDVPR
jgi:hypothetical protein